MNIDSRNIDSRRACGARDRSPSEAAPWPLARQAPRTFVDGAFVDADRPRLKELVALLRPGAVFRFEDRAVAVVAADPLP